MTSCLDSLSLHVATFALTLTCNARFNISFLRPRKWQEIQATSWQGRRCARELAHSALQCAFHMLLMNKTVNCIGRMESFLPFAV